METLWKGRGDLFFFHRTFLDNIICMSQCIYYFVVSIVRALYHGHHFDFNRLTQLQGYIDKT